MDTQALRYTPKLLREWCQTKHSIEKVGQVERDLLVKYLVNAPAGNTVVGSCALRPCWLSHATDEPHPYDLGFTKASWKEPQSSSGFALDGTYLQTIVQKTEYLR